MSIFLKKRKYIKRIIYPGMFDVGTELKKKYLTIFNSFKTSG